MRPTTALQRTREIHPCPMLDALGPATPSSSLYAFGSIYEGHVATVRAFDRLLTDFDRKGDAEDLPGARSSQAGVQDTRH